MKVFKNVRSTAEYVQSIEVNVDTVYLRSNIKRIEEAEFSGWEYDEKWIDKDKYFEEMQVEIDLLSDMLDFMFREVNK